MYKDFYLSRDAFQQRTHRGCSKPQISVAAKKIGCATDALYDKGSVHRGIAS
jgi:hypothetical protein